MGLFSELMIDIEERLFEGQQPAEIATALGLSEAEVMEQIQQIQQIEAWHEDDGQPTEYEEWQDLYGGDDAFETCSYCEDF